MLQHVTVGRRTEIDAINGALIREESPWHCDPYNESLVAMLKGREQNEFETSMSQTRLRCMGKQIADDALPPTT